MSVGQPGTAVVTGATGGIGRYVAAGLVKAGFHVVLVARDAGRGAAALDWIQATLPGGRAEAMVADLSSRDATRALGRRIAACHPRVSILVNNAGVFRARRERTAEGRDLVLMVNHLAPFILVRELENALCAGAPSRLVTIGSSTSDPARIDPADLEFQRRRWGMVRAYAQSKLATMMTTFEWAQRWKDAGITANVVHPGMVATGLVRTPGVIGLAWRLMAPWLRTAEQGADTPLHVALANELAGVTGFYFKNRGVATPNPLAHDALLRRQLWAATEDLVRPEAVPINSSRSALR